MKSVYDRFQEKYRENNGCWEWIGAIDEKGHARLSIDGKNYLAHKYSFELYNNRYAVQQIKHTCKMLHCVNPAHLIEEENKGRPIRVIKADVVKAHQKGLSIKELAAKFNCSESLIRKKIGPSN